MGTNMLRPILQMGRERMPVLKDTVNSTVAFLVRNFQFRYVNVYQYLLDYSRGNTRKVDLIVTHLVDYDWPIGDGTSTPTSLSNQVRVMERISQVSGGARSLEEHTILSRKLRAKPNRPTTRRKIPTSGYQVMTR